MTSGVHCVRGNRSRCTPNGGAACSISNHHAIAKELCNNFNIRCFAAACACAGEFEERSFELRADNRLLVLRVSFRSNFFSTVVPEIHLSTFFVCVRNHCEGFNRADVYARTAFEAVELVNDNGNIIFFTRFSFSSNFITCRSSCSFFFSCQYRTDCSVRADEGTLHAADTFFSIPSRNVKCRACFFKFSCARRHCAVFAASKCGNREVIANLAEHWSSNICEVFCSRTAFNNFIRSVSPRSRVVNFVEFFDTSINSAIVHVNDFLAFLAIALDDGIF